jgi:uncharacterized protein (DUF486 family)
LVGHLKFAEMKNFTKKLIRDCTNKLGIALFEYFFQFRPTDATGKTRPFLVVELKVLQEVIT